MKAFGTSDRQKEASNAQTYRQGLQPLFVELSLLTRHPEVVVAVGVVVGRGGGGGERWGEGGRKGGAGVRERRKSREIWEGKRTGVPH